jgi:ubiquinone/menaquinone biosynthesis C-methylase UbiE
MPDRPVTDSVERFSGFAALYDEVRPVPPVSFTELLSQLARSSRPTVVVDLGSGTGVSALIWAGRAERVVAVEPNVEMRAVAAARLSSAPGTEFELRDVRAADTGLQDACADVVTCSQSLHWLDPETTFPEVARVLRPGGVFAAIDCDWPPAIDWEVDAAYDRMDQATRRLEAELGVVPRRWEKSGHLARMRGSGAFRWATELALGNVESGGADRLIALADTQGGVVALRQAGVADEEIGLEDLRRVATKVLGQKARPWWWTYRVRVGVV